MTHFYQIKCIPYKLDKTKKNLQLLRLIRDVTNRIKQKVKQRNELMMFLMSYE